MIVVDQLGLRVAGRTLLESASFAMSPGEFVAVMGANGAGKTTLLRTLAGVRPIQQGTIRVSERPLGQLSGSERAALIAHVTGDDVFMDKLRVRDVVSMGRYAHHRWWNWNSDARDEAAIDAALEDVRMAAFAERFFDTLSSGERQRVWLALALAQQAPVLLLDEPTSHLDVRASQDVLHLLRAQSKRGKTIVCALHDLNEAAQAADRILLLGEGAVLAFDTPAAVLAGDAVARAYGVNMEVTRSSSGALRVFPAQPQ